MNTGLCKNPDDRELAHRFEFVCASSLTRDVYSLAVRLPGRLAGVVGIPRGGMVPAALLASTLNLPLYQVDPKRGLRLIGSGSRVTARKSKRTPLLVVDDFVCSGATMSAATAVIPERVPVVSAAVYVRSQSRASVDCYGRIVDSTIVSEWNLFRRELVRRLASSLENVLIPNHKCERETNSSSPIWIPRECSIPLVVTARPESRRVETLEMLGRFGIQVDRLIMRPSTTSAAADASAFASYKSRAFAQSEASLFIESHGVVAQRIAHFARKPVLCTAERRIFYAKDKHCNGESTCSAS